MVQLLDNGEGGNGWPKTEIEKIELLKAGYCRREGYELFYISTFFSPYRFLENIYHEHTENS